jgi:exodeoxyribonuclease-1
MAQLIRSKQPDLFKYLLDVRDKKQAQALIDKGEPFVYTTGRYSSEYLHTSAAVFFADHPQPSQALVYDLRYDPEPFVNLSIDELIERWRFTKEPEAPPRLPIKTVKYNRCPAVAPLGVMKDAASQKRIGLTTDTVAQNLARLKKYRKPFAEKVLQARKRLDAEREAEQVGLVDNQLTADARLYERFLDDADRAVLSQVRAAEPGQLGNFIEQLRDERLKSLLPLYKARNYPASLTGEELADWEAFCARRLFDGGPASSLAKYFNRLKELAAGSLNGEQRYILEELQLYGQSIVPSDADGSAVG